MAALRQRRIDLQALTSKVPDHNVPLLSTACPMRGALPRAGLHPRGAPKCAGLSVRGVGIVEKTGSEIAKPPVAPVSGSEIAETTSAPISRLSLTHQGKVSYFTKQ